MVNLVQIISNLATSPEFAALSATPAETLNELAGIQYPFDRLMEQAIRAAAPLKANEADRVALMSAARKMVPEGPRVFGPYAEDCGCVKGQGDMALVYAFYPFWLADLANADDAVETDTAPDPDAEPAPAPGYANIDYELVERVAFDGLLIDGDREYKRSQLRKKMKELEVLRKHLTKPETKPIIDKNNPFS